MEILSIAFLGKVCGCREKIEEKLEKLIHVLTEAHELTECLVMKGNDFNFLASEIIDRMKPCYDGKLEHTLVLPSGVPYEKKNRNDFVYDRIEFADIMENGGEEFSALSRWMIESSDILICCILDMKDCTNPLLQYALSRKMCIYNLAEAI